MHPKQLNLFNLGSFLKYNLFKIFIIEYTVRHGGGYRYIVMLYYIMNEFKMIIQNFY